MQPIVLAELKPVATGREAALFDLGEGVACLEFRSKGNSISAQVVTFLNEVLEQHMADFDGLVIGNQAKHYSVGADLTSFRRVIEDKDFEAFHTKMSRFQAMAYAVKSFPKPIVAAPYGNVLGGGLELVLHCRRRVAHRDVRMGLVEVGVGLLPSGGGVTETALWAAGQPDPDTALLTGFDGLIRKKKSKGAREALDMGYLQPEDVVTDDLAGLITEAKGVCRDMAAEPRKPYVEQSVRLPGAEGFRRLLSHAATLREQGLISPYDQVVGGAIAEILTGGETDPRTATEHQLMDAEREHFVALTRDKRTYERICYLLDQGGLLAN